MISIQIVWADIQDWRSHICLCCKQTGVHENAMSLQQSRTSTSQRSIVSKNQKVFEKSFSTSEFKQLTGCFLSGNMFVQNKCSTHSLKARQGHFWYLHSLLLSQKKNCEPVALVEHEICGEDQWPFCYFPTSKNLTLHAVTSNFTTIMNTFSLPHLSFETWVTPYFGRL